MTKMTIRRRTIGGGGVAVALVALTVMLAGCAPVTDDTDEAGRSEPSLSQFTEQDLAFEPCEPAAGGPGVEGSECAMLEVPLDYENPGKQTIEVAVHRVAATGDDRIGSLVLNPGGPGGSGTTFVPFVAGAWAQHPAREQFDLIGLDPRGVGASIPAVECFSGQQRDNNALIAAIPPAGMAWTEATVHSTYEQCATGSGGEEVLEHLGTRDAARDLDVLREVLGDEQLSFLGVSYGTRLGAIYAEMFPQNVRALVLDAVMDPRKDLAERQLQLVGGLQKSFEQLAAVCAEQPDCALGPDPAQATTELQSLLQPLVENPIVTSSGREVTFFTALEGVVTGLYAESAWPAVIKSLNLLSQGNADGILAVRDIYNGRSEAGTYTNAVDASFAINCIDEKHLTADETTDLVNDVKEVAPFMDPGVDVETAFGCEGWPDDKALDFPYATDIDGLPQTLVVSVKDDGLTPHEGAVAMADQLGGTLLTVDGNQHGATTAMIPCVDDIVAKYLIDLEVPAEGANCSL